jgi:hypothetical protein
MAGSKQQVFYIHGGNAFSQYDDFLTYLRTKEIRDLPFSESLAVWSQSLVPTLGTDYEVFAPTMPNKQNAKYQEWKIWFERHFEYVHDEVIMVGWSLGGYFLLKYLVENETPFSIKSLLLLAAPFEPADGSGEDGGDFVFDTAQVHTIAKRASNITIMHSKDDFVVPFTHAEKLASALPKADLVIFEDKNHFLIEDFPELINKIKAV